MSNIARGGFRPLHPGMHKARRYEVDSNFGTAIFPGDVVTLVTAGTVQPASAGGADLILGVVSACTFVQSGVRVYGSHIPANTVYSPSTRLSKNASYAYVWDDPEIEYVASVSGTNTAATVAAMIGANADILATAGDTIYRRSNHQIDGASVTTGTLRFRILDILRDPAQDLTSANWRAIVKINEGFDPMFSQAGI
jgi:hypothetical protein